MPVVLLHLVAISLAIVISTLNLKGLWLGKELTGPSGHDAEKLLALQFAAKLHELMMLASLSHILFLVYTRQLLSGDGLPFGAVTAAFRFSQISYLWSSEFIATCTITFSGKLIIVPAIIIVTCLGVSIGPSSATALRPTLDDWPGGGTSFWLNGTAHDLWPSNLSLSSTGNHSSVTSPELYGSSNAWNTLADNFFTYWGYKALGEIRAMPESAQIPGRVSVRTLNVRFRGPFTLYQPEITTATIQPAAISDVVNEIRQTWLRANGNRCYSAEGIRKRAFCSYRDISWSVNAEQPAVYVVCHGSNSTTVPLFPTFSDRSEKQTLAELAVNVSDHGSGSISSIQWVQLTGTAFANTSIGALVRPTYPYQSENDDVYACSVDAQWANATIQSSFLGLPYIVNGVPPKWFQPQTHTGGRYQGRRVSISPAWAALANPPLPVAFQTDNSNNLTTTTTMTATPFDKLFAAASSSALANDTAQKIEAVLAVIFADRMARICADTALQGNMTDIDQVLRPSKGDLFTHPGPSSSYHPFFLDTAVTGYAYGLRTSSGILASTLFAVLILLIYVVIGTSYVIYTGFFSHWCVNAWKGMTELLALALHSDVTDVEAMRNTSAGIGTFGPLQTPIAFMAREGHVEMVFGKDGKVSRETGEGVEKVVGDTAYS
jgi:hypothetical protein